MSLLAFAGSAIQLVPDGTLLFHVALIFGMVSLLNLTLLRPINRVLEERERRTKGRSGEAQRVLRSVEARMLENEARLREARGSGYTLLLEERGAAVREHERKMSEAKAEVTRWRDGEKEKLKNDEADLKASLMKDARVQAAEIGGRILGREVGRRER